MTLSDYSEDDLIQRLTLHLPKAASVQVGPGDDCAVVELGNNQLQLLKTDCVVEGIHFLSEEDPERVGWKAAARVVSDFAAMGGEPEHIVVTVILRPNTKIEWISGVYRGIRRCAERYHFSIVGGETSSTSEKAPNSISVAGTGSVKKEQLILRSGAKVGDAIFVTGKLGGSIKGKHLDFEPRVPEAQWLSKHFKPSAMMDLSDGLGKDLPRLAQLTNISYTIDLESIPCTQGCSTKDAIQDGEDYELLFTLNESSCEEMLDYWPSYFPPVTKIGTIVDPSIPPTSLTEGWDHFKATPEC